MELFFGIESLGVLIFAFCISLLAGMIKGVVGFALPTVMISGLGSVTTADVAIAGMILPTLFTNGWQAVRHGVQAALASIAKFKVFLIVGFVVMMCSTQLVPVLPGDTLLLVLGGLVTVFVGLQILGIQPRVRGHPGPRLQSAFGGAAGLMGGVSGIWGPPTVAMLTALEIEKKEHVRIQGVIYCLGALALVVGHLGSGVLRAETLPLSLALAPTALLGMAIGFQIQDRIAQETFRKAIMAVLLIGGLNLIRRGMFG